MMRSLIALCLASWCLMSCASSSPGAGEPSSPTVPTGRVPLIDPSDPLYGRFEAPDANNNCYSDADCMKTGCSAEVCAAEKRITTCELPVGGWPTQGHSCGCVSGQCIWWR